MKLRNFYSCLFIISFLLTGCVHLNTKNPDNHLAIHFIDVGYGDAILITRSDFTCLIDGGYPTVTDSLKCYLHKNNVNRLDLAVLTHPHPDHMGGLYGVLNSGLSVDRVICPWKLNSSEIPAGFRELINRLEIPYEIVRDGHRVCEKKGLKITAVHPEELWSDMNDSSLVLFLEVGEIRVLLTADIGPAGQERLEKEYPQIFPVTILKAPHHGGESRGTFYSLARPLLTVISDGVNPYGNPWESTLETASRHSDRVIRLSDSGTIIVEISEKEMTTPFTVKKP